MSAAAPAAAGPNYHLHTAFRIISVVLVLLFGYNVRSDRPYLAIIFSITFGHYLLSVIYARNQITRIVQQPSVLVMCLGLLAVVCGLFFSGFSLLIYFAVHHVFNEVYLLSRSVPVSDPEGRRLRTSSIILNFFIYFTILRKDLLILPFPSMVPHDVEWTRSLAYRVLTFLLVVNLVASYAAFATCVARVRKRVSRGELIDICSFEIAGLALVILSCFVKIRFLDLVLYHVVFWAMFPLPGMLKKSAGEAWQYVALTIATTAVFLLISPISSVSFRLSEDQWWSQFYFWGYFHITMSFALSRAHPAWIVKWFFPGRMAKAQVGS